MNTGMNITKKAEIFASHLVEVARTSGASNPPCCCPKRSWKSDGLAGKREFRIQKKEFVAQNISASKLMLMPDEEPNC